MTATVFGASGFIANDLVYALGQLGFRVVVPFRNNGEEIRHHRLAGELGMVVPLHFHLRDHDSIYRCVQESEIVVNLIGREWETRNFSFHDVHVEGADAIASISKEAGVKRFIQCSALGADISHPNKSKFLQSKLEGEETVRKYFPDATVIRPARIFHKFDRFLNWYAEMIKLFSIAPHLGGSIQPVSLKEVVQAFVCVLNDSSTFGKTYELGGPEIFDYDTITQLVMENAHLESNVVNTKLIKLFYQPMVTALMHFYPGEPKWTAWDAFEQTSLDIRVKPGALTQEHLGITETYSLRDQVHDILFKYNSEILNRYEKPERAKRPRKRGGFGKELGQL